MFALLNCVLLFEYLKFTFLLLEMGMQDLMEQVDSALL
jgi:hypothetical protein